MDLRRQAARILGCSATALAVLFAWSGSGAADTPVVTLLSPKNGAVVTRTTTKSPLFKWQASGSLVGLFVELQISTDRTFPTLGTATDRWYCGSTGTDCPSSKQYVNSSWWYTNSDGCTYIPPIGGGCKNGVNASERYYWRVQVGDAVSPIWTMQVTSGGDRTPPHVSTQRGSGRRGAVGYFDFFVWDDGSSTRLSFDLVRARRVVLRASVGWGSHGQGLQERLSIRLPKALKAGGYNWCMTAFDRAGNHAKSCARYAIA